MKHHEHLVVKCIAFNVGKTIINHPPVITIFIGGIKPFTVMAGLWHCFSCITNIMKSIIAVTNID